MSVFFLNISSSLFAIKEVFSFISFSLCINISSIYFNMRRRFRDVSERGYFKSTSFSGTR